MKIFQTAAKKYLPSGFSLPEVAIAVAIAALSLVSIMGLLPSGLESVRQSGVVTGEARIVRHIVGSLQMQDWGAFNGDSWAGVNTMIQQGWYYDDQANPIETTAGVQANMQDLAYVARVHLGAGVGNTHPTIPGAHNQSSNSLIVLIDVASTNNPRFTFPDPRRYSTHTAILTRQFSNPWP